MPDNRSLQSLDLNLLKVFECLYREQNMTRAAESLFITPSAVSHAIKRLRDGLDDPLFVRRGQSMQPTPVCHRLAPQLLEALTKIRLALQQRGVFRPTDSEQTFRLAIHDALEPLVLPRLLKLFASQAPYAKLNSVKLDRDNTARQLSSGQIDAAIDVALPRKDPIEHTCLSSDPFCVMASRQQFAQTVLTKQSYLNAEHIAVSHRPSGRVMEDIALQQQGITRNIKVRCQNYHTAKEVLKASRALLTLPSLLASQLLDEELVKLSLPQRLPAMETHLYWHQSSNEDDAMIWFRQQIRDVFDTLQ